MKIKHCLIELSLFALTLGCGKSSSETFVDGYCTEVAKCCGKAGLPSDGKTCRQFMGLMTSGGGYNASAGDACLAEMRAEAAAGTFCDGSGSSSATCDSVYKTASGGSKKPGETCEFDSDCAKSAEGKVACDSAYLNNDFVYKCQLQMEGKAGDSPCVGTQDGNVIMGYSDSNATDVVARGYVCDLAKGIRCDSGTCKALVGVGGTCSSSSQCSTDLYCDYVSDKCAPRVAVGGACAGSSSDLCVATAYCDSTSKKCSAQLANGVACTKYDMCLSNVCTDSVCKDSGLDGFGLGLLCGS